MSAAHSLDLFGVPRAACAGIDLRFPDRKATALVAMLAVEGTATRARLASLLWDEDGEGDVRRNLRRELHRLRDAGFEALLRSDGDRLVLHPDTAIDVAAFNTAVDEGNAERALALYRAPLLEGFDLGGATGFQAWLAERRDALAQRWSRVVEGQCQAAQVRGDLRGALALALALVHADGLQEGACCRAMALHDALGEREAALALYERIRRRLGRELGLRPLATTVELAERIRRGTTSARAAAERAAPGLQLGLPGEAPLVGRDALLEAAGLSLRERRFVIVEGAPGIGKSRLLRELQARHAGARLHAARVGDRRVPYAALARWLRERAADAPTLPAWAQAEVARLLPELGVAAPPLASDAGRLRLYEAVAEAWRGGFADAALHLFDDWQFVDEASAAWWAWWQADAGVQVVVALRPGEAGEGAHRVLHEARRTQGAAVLEVPALGADAVFALVRGLSGVARPQRFADRLWRATGGHPFYTLETLQHLLQSGIVRIDALGRWETPFDSATQDYGELPIAPSVQAAVTQRLDMLGEGARRLVDAACLIEDEFGLGLVAAASALDEWGAVHAVEEALQARVLLRDVQHPGRFRFEHDLFAQSAATALSPERRALLHRALARRLAQDGAAPARIADHHAQAGDLDAAREYRMRALREARRRMVPAEVLAQADAVLASGPTTEQAVRAQLARADALRARAEPEAAGLALAAALALVGPALPRALRVDAVAAQAVHAMRDGRPADVLGPLATALDEPGLDGEQRATLLLRRADCLRTLGRRDESDADLQAALAALGDEPSAMLADLLDSVSRNTLIAGDSAACLRWATRAAEVADAADQHGARAQTRMMGGVALMYLGRLADAEAMLVESRAIASRQGLVAQERGAILNLAIVLLARGQRRRAIDALDAGQGLSRWWSSAAEQHAFAEAHYQTRVDEGELGGALDRRDALVATSVALQDVERGQSGLLVSLDLPLLLGDGELAASAVERLTGALDGVGAFQGGRICAKLGWAALVAGRHRDALALVERGAGFSGFNPGSKTYLQIVGARAWLALGDAARACDAIGVLPEGAGGELNAMFVATAMRAERAARRLGTARLDEARRMFDTGNLPKLQALELLDALLSPGDEDPRIAEACLLAKAMHDSLAAHPRQQALFVARYGRWLSA